MTEQNPVWLTWVDNQNSLASLHERYMTCVAGAFGDFLAKGRLHNAAVAMDIIKGYDDLPDECKVRVMLAPESTFRLFWRRQQGMGESMNFFQQSIIAEKIRFARVPKTDGKEQASPKWNGLPLWTATGDFGLLDDGSIVEAPIVLSGSLRADCCSPYARGTEVAEASGHTIELRRPPTDVERDLILEKLSRAGRYLEECNPCAAAFVAGFTKALVAQPDDQMPNSFASGSSGQYVGRSALWNIHGTGIDEVDIVEGLVHEAIHSLLYMQERLVPWVIDLDLYGPELRTRSPWTGNALPLRPFLQACFVWYGLLNFWVSCIGMGRFPEHRVKERILQAIGGFSRVDLLTHIHEYLPRLDKELVESIREMQRRVLSVV